MNGIIFAPKYDKPADAANPSGHDATGAFQPGATIFQGTHNLSTPILFDNNQPQPDRQTFILGKIRSATDKLDVVAYFGHGIKTSLPSAGFSTANIPDGKAGVGLATTIAGNANHGVKVILYACSAGEVGGFASQLATALSLRNATVYGHEQAGHTFTNPLVRRYPAGTYVIAPNDKLFKKWCAVLENSRLDPYNNNRLWAEFPFMTDAELSKAVQIIPDLFARWEVTFGDKPTVDLTKFGLGAAVFDYVFFPDHDVYMIDPANPMKKLFSGRWSIDATGLKVKWTLVASFLDWDPSKTRVEEWDFPLNFQAQTGQTQDKNFRFTARRKDPKAITLKDKKKFT